MQKTRETDKRTFSNRADRKIFGISERFCMIRFFILGSLLSFAIFAGLGRESQLWGQNVPELNPGSFACPKCREFPNYEKIFNPENQPEFPKNYTQEQMVQAFCKTCRVIDACLQEINALQSEIEKLNQELEKQSPVPNVPLSAENSLSVPSPVPASNQEAEIGRERLRLGAEIQKKRDQITRLALKIHTHYHQILDWIGPIWNLAPKEPEVVQAMLFLLVRAIESDQYEAAYVLSRELMAKKTYEENPMVYQMAGISAFMMGKFDVARLCFEEAQKKDALSASAAVYRELIPYYLQAWKTELTFRKQEELKGELPRVQFQTTKGTFEIVLYEDSAPETVKLFLDLVRTGAYDGIEFPSVISGLFAKTGKPVLTNTADGTQIQLPAVPSSNQENSGSNSVPSTGSGNGTSAIDPARNQNSTFSADAEASGTPNVSDSSAFPASGSQTTANGKISPAGEITFPEEFRLANARKHFRGSVVLAHDGIPASANGQFFIMLVPAPQLDGKFTVFGRVTKGMSVVAALQRIDERKPETSHAVPDKIISAVILNRTH